MLFKPSKTGQLSLQMSFNFDPNTTQIRLHFDPKMTQIVTISNDLKHFETIFPQISKNKKMLQTRINTRFKAFFISLKKMDLRGIEPLSESSSIKTSPITVIILTFPPLFA